MTEEIKRIIEKLKDNIPIEEYRSEGTSDGLTHYEEDKDSWQYKLLDYITNLQEELEISKDKAETYRLEMQEITKIFGLDEHTLFDDVKEYATDLRQENKAKTHQIEVLEEIVNYERNIRNDKLQQENKELNRMCELYSKSLYNAELTDYKSRCEKAIKYIKSTNCYGMRSGKTLLQKYLYALLNILNGSDEK